MMKKCGAVPVVTMSILMLLLFAASCWADNPANPDYVLQEFHEMVEGYIPTLLKYARSLFMALATISLGFGLGQMLLSGESNLGTVAAHLTKWIVYVGFFTWVMSEAFFIPQMVVDSFIQAGEQIAGSEVMPGDVLIRGIDIFGALMDAAFALGFVKIIVAGLAGIVVIIVYAILAAVIAVTLVEMYLIICGGSILLGFAGSEFTKDIALSYLKYSVSVGVKLLAIMLVATVARDMSEKWVESLVNIGEGDFFRVVGYLLGGSVTLTLAAYMIPNIAQGMITGASLSTGGMMRASAAAMMAPAMVAGRSMRNVATGVSNTSHAMNMYRTANPQAGTLRNALNAGANAATAARAQGAGYFGAMGSGLSAASRAKPFETMGAGIKYARDAAVFGQHSRQAWSNFSPAQGQKGGGHDAKAGTSGGNSQASGPPVGSPAWRMQNPYGRNHANYVDPPE